MGSVGFWLDFPFVWTSFSASGGGQEEDRRRSSGAVVRIQGHPLPWYPSLFELWWVVAMRVCSQQAKTDSFPLPVVMVSPNNMWTLGVRIHSLKNVSLEDDGQVPWQLFFFFLYFSPSSGFKPSILILHHFSLCRFSIQSKPTFRSHFQLSSCFFFSLHDSPFLLGRNATGRSILDLYHRFSSWAQPRSYTHAKGRSFFIHKRRHHSY